MTIKARFYAAPNGIMTEHEISNVYPKDELFFKENNIIISIEYLNATAEFVVYGRYADDVLEENELLVISGTKTCEEMLRELAMEFRAQ